MVVSIISTLFVCQLFLFFTFFFNSLCCLWPGALRGFRSLRRPIGAAFWCTPRHVLYVTCLIHFATQEVIKKSNSHTNNLEINETTTSYIIRNQNWILYKGCIYGRQSIDFIHYAPQDRPSSIYRARYAIRT